MASLVFIAACTGATAFVACSDDTSRDSASTPRADAGAKGDATTTPKPDPTSDAAPEPVGDGGAPDGGWVLTIQEETLAKSQSPLPALPPSPGNKYADNPGAAALGQQFFFDKSYAGPISAVPNDLGSLNETGKVSCASCHVMPWGTDTRSSPNDVSLGTSWTPRNSPPITNVAFYEWFYWDGRTDSLWQQAVQAGENAIQQASDRLRIGRVVYTKYKAEYEAVFAADFGPLDDRFDPANGSAFPASGKPKASPSAPDGAWEGLSAPDQAIVTRVLVNWGKAIEAYERLLVSRNAPWDKFVAGDKGAISQRAVHGYKLFVTKGYCVNCHSGPLFSDNKLHNIGVPMRAGAPDKGRYDTIVKALGNSFRADGKWSDDPDAGARKLATQHEFDAGIAADGGLNFDLNTDLGMFRTKHLRQIEHTGPYMHTGSLATLGDVMNLYSAGGGDSGIGTLDKAFQGHVAMSADEVADVIEFMKTLTGATPPASLLTDTSKP